MRHAREVTYKGHTLTVPVLDRGPYAHHASWDLTAGAAGALGITETVRIGTQVVGKTANTPTLGLPATLEHGPGRRLTRRLTTAATPRAGALAGLAAPPGDGPTAAWARERAA